MGTVETLVDDGHVDLYADHIPLMAGDRRVGTAYPIGFMKALLRRANEEVDVVA